VLQIGLQQRVVFGPFAFGYFSLLFLWDFVTPNDGALFINTAHKI